MPAALATLRLRPGENRRRLIGTWPICSTPPTRHACASPVMIIRAASCSVCMDEPHKRIDGNRRTECGTSASSAALRAILNPLLQRLLHTTPVNISRGPPLPASGYAPAGYALNERRDLCTHLTKSTALRTAHRGANCIDNDNLFHCDSLSQLSGRQPDGLAQPGDSTVRYDALYYADLPAPYSGPRC